MEEVKNTPNPTIESAPEQAEITQTATDETPQPIPVTDKSKFTGGAFANFIVGFLALFVSLVSLGFAYPAMMCWKMRWKFKHTVINGKHLSFDGKAMQLLGKFVLWMFLSIITLGVYLMVFLPFNLRKWQIKHTHFEGANGESKFDGTILGLFGVNFVSIFVTIITLTFGSYWARCYRERWYAKHEIIDGCRMKFDGTGMQYFATKIKWVLLTVVTLGIYSFWLIVKSLNWTISHKHAENINDIPVTYQVIEKETKPAETASGTTISKDKLGFILSATAFLAGPLLSIIGIIMSAKQILPAKKEGFAVAGVAVGFLSMFSLSLLTILGNMFF